MSLTRSNVGEKEMKAEFFLPDDYRPAEDEPFMNERQLEYFRRKLISWREELLEGSRDTIEGLQESTRNIPDGTCGCAAARQVPNAHAEGLRRLPSLCEGGRRGTTLCNTLR